MCPQLTNPAITFFSNLFSASWCLTQNKGYPGNIYFQKIYTGLEKLADFPSNDTSSVSFPHPCLFQTISLPKDSIHPFYSPCFDICFLWDFRRHFGESATYGACGMKKDTPFVSCSLFYVRWYPSTLVGGNHWNPTALVSASWREFRSAACFVFWKSSTSNTWR